VIDLKIADRHQSSKKTFNNAISALRRAFAFRFEDHPELHVLIAAIHREWGEAQGN
jgi:hypothetical protein